MRVKRFDNVYLFNEHAVPEKEIPNGISIHRMEWTFDLEEHYTAESPI